MLFLQNSLKPFPKWWPISVFAVSFLGFLDASYLTISYVTKTSVECSFVHGCDVVLTSSYATVGGIPIALFGVLYYLTMLLSLIAFLDWKKIVFLEIVLMLPLAGFFVSAGLVGLQMFVLKAFCLYCLVSAFLTLLLFFLAL